MKFNVVAKEIGGIGTGTFVRLKRYFKFDHAFVLKVEGKMVYHMSVGVAAKHEAVGNLGVVMGEMAINPSHEIYPIQVGLVEWTDLKKPVEPKSNDEDEIADWLVDNEEYEDAMNKLQRHICNKEEILYLIHMLKTCDLDGKTIEIADLAQLEKPIAQIEL